MAGPSGASYRKKQANDPGSRRFPLAKDAEDAKEEQGGSPNGNPFSHRDAECTENVPPGSETGRGIINYRTDPFSDPFFGRTSRFRGPDTLWRVPWNRLLAAVIFGFDPIDLVSHFF